MITPPDDTNEYAGGNIRKSLCNATNVLDACCTVRLRSNWISFASVAAVTPEFAAAVYVKRAAVVPPGAAGANAILALLNVYRPEVPNCILMEPEVLPAFKFNAPEALLLIVISEFEPEEIDCIAIPLPAAALLIEMPVADSAVLASINNAGFVEPFKPTANAVADAEVRISPVPVAVPIFGVIRTGDVSTTNFVPVPVCDAIDVALPTEVITPVRFAFVVTVAAFPVTLPDIGFVTVRFINVPTLVRLEAVTPEARVAPVRVPAGAITTLLLAAVISPFALTVNVGIDVEDPKVPTFEFTVVNVIAPVLANVASPLNAVSVATLLALPINKWPEVKDGVDADTAAVTKAVVAIFVVLSPGDCVVVVGEPGNATELAILVALPTLVIGPVKLALVVTVAAFPRIDPEIGLVTVRFVRVPTEVKEDVTTVVFKVVPVSVPAAAGTVMSIVPLNRTPFIFLPGVILVADAA